MMSKASKTSSTVQSVRQLTESTTVLCFDRNGQQFEPGQHLRIGKPGANNPREYSVYSANTHDTYEVLVKEITDGHVSPILCDCRPGDTLEVEGPFGCFVPKKEERQHERFMFIATGTGIAPFHSMVASHPEMDYILLHGTSTCEELYECDRFAPERFISCVSRENGGSYRGRVTSYLRQTQIDPLRHYYLCGNCEMIYEVFEILATQGVPRTRMHAEIYF